MKIVKKTEFQYPSASYRRPGPFLIDELTCKDDEKAYERVKEIVSASEFSPEYCRYIEGFANLLDNAKSYIRTRAFILICSQSRWDNEGRIKRELPRMAKLLNDPKPTVVRQCLSALKEVAVFRPELSGELSGMLEGMDFAGYKDTMRPLIRRDAEELSGLLHEHGSSV